MKRDLMNTTGLRTCDTPETVAVISADDAALVELFYGDSARPYQISGFGHGFEPPWPDMRSWIVHPDRSITHLPRWVALEEDRLDRLPLYGDPMETQPFEGLKVLLPCDPERITIGGVRYVGGAYRDEPWP